MSFKKIKNIQIIIIKKIVILLIIKKIKKISNLAYFFPILFQNLNENLCTKVL